jgi:hypothetical protein
MPCKRFLIQFGVRCMTGNKPPRKKESEEGKEEERSEGLTY